MAIRCRTSAHDERGYGPRGFDSSWRVLPFVFHALGSVLRNGRSGQDVIAWLATGVGAGVALITIAADSRAARLRRDRDLRWNSPMRARAQRRNADRSRSLRRNGDAGLQ